MLPKKLTIKQQECLYRFGSIYPPTKPAEQNGNKPRNPLARCCVGGCQNTAKKQPDLIFYEFPSEVREQENRAEWIRRIRKTRYSETWKPSRNCTVCNKHFIKGKKSENPRSLSFMPMIFPSYKYTIPKMHLPADTSDNSRSSPSQIDPLVLEEPSPIKIEPEFIDIKNEELEIPLSTNDFDTLSFELPILPKVNVNPVSKKVQTEPNFEHAAKLASSQKPPNVLFCAINGNDVCIQTNIFINTKFIPSHNNAPQREKVVVQCSHQPLEFGFRGVQNINSDLTMVSLAGVSQKCFNKLLEVIVPGQDGQCKYFSVMSKENRLLSLLMKLKLGLQFAALSCLFCLKQMTINKIFYQTLMTVALKTKSWITWPSRADTNKLRKPFLVYPNIRCILEILEIETELKDKIKFLMCFTTDGLICKVSKSYTEDDSDGFIARDSGFLDDVDPEDTVLASRHFPEIELALREKNVNLVNASDSHPCTDENTKGNISDEVAKIVKTIYTLQVLSNKIPNNLVPCINDVVQVCCVIVNGHFASED